MMTIELYRENKRNLKDCQQVYNIMILNNVVHSMQQKGLTGFNLGDLQREGNDWYQLLVELSKLSVEYIILTTGREEDNELQAR